MKNIFFFRRINSIGGIETFFFQIAMKYADNDITIYYIEGDENQVKRLSEYVQVRRYKGEKIKCEKAFFNFNLDIINNVDAKEYIQIIHGDYQAMGITPNTNPKINKYIGITQHVCDTFTKMTGLPCELCYNPFVAPKIKKPLRLVSTTRLTREKGRDRIIKLADALAIAGVPFIWTVFTDSNQDFDNSSIVKMQPRIDILPFVADADYLVQLSDNEGYCYSVVEALSIGTPVIVTDLPVFREIGINEENAIVLPLDMNNIPTDKIAKKMKRVNYAPPKDQWNVLLAKGKSRYDPETTTKVRAIRVYNDIELNKVVNSGESWETTKRRAAFLESKNLVEVVI